MSSIKYKKTELEKENLKKAKKDWLKSMKKIDPTITKSSNVYDGKITQFEDLGKFLKDISDRKVLIMN